MKYDGLFTRPAGLIYGSFDPGAPHLLALRHPARMAALRGNRLRRRQYRGHLLRRGARRRHPDGRFIAYREYKAGERSAADHCYHLMKGEPAVPLCAGGSMSESQWRAEFRAGGTAKNEHGVRVRVPGLPIHGPDQPDVEVGIEQVWKAFALDKLLIFEDLHGLLDELQSYSRELDVMGEPTEKIDAKETFHYADALRYLIGYLKFDKPKAQMNKSPVARQGLQNL